MRELRSLVSVIGLLQAAATVTIVFSFLTAVDIPHRNVELFSHFRLQYFVITVALMLVFAAVNRPRIVLALLLTSFLNGSMLIDWYLQPAFSAAGTEQVKLMHANVYSINDNYRSLIDLVAAENPDIIFLQEITASWESGIKSLQNDYPHTYIESRNGNFGIAVYSRIPFKHVQTIDSPPLGRPSIIATMEIGGKSLTLLSTHPTIPLGQYSYGVRNEQIASVADEIADTAGAIIVLGDFNASMWDPHYRNLIEATNLRSARHGYGVLPTWPTFMPFAMIPIDHVLVSAGIEVTDMATGADIGSDHLPLIVTVSL